MSEENHSSNSQTHCSLNFQVLEAVYDLHSRGIVHRDLKPENLLLYDNQASSKLLVVDFGLSEYEEELNKDSPVCGTATYLAPEVIITNFTIFKK